MSKRVSNPVLSQETAKKLLLNCMICGKAVEGFYGQHQDGGTCSRACEKAQNEKPRYGEEHSEEAYLRRHGESFDVDDILSQGA